MEYCDYKIARNLAWKVLIECDIREFSVNLAKIINHYGIYLIRYSILIGTAHLTKMALVD